MASLQSRRESATSERENSVERDRVPKMASHFESLIEKPKEPVVKKLIGEDDNETGAQFEFLAEKMREAGTDFSSDHKEREGREEQEQQILKAREGYSVGKFDVEGGRKETKVKEDENGSDRNKEQQLSLDEITKLRETAQKNSLEALKAAEERYEKAKNKASQVVGSAKNTVC
ncbi:hypothetical protein OIU77_006491 [Salix suchowensis]|uniref:Uncharacterized protein n=1 Tax=Salix suchowensis TaxID=1278906 RepID=A0ABQ9AKV0_9ROSI|nr:hypothetical protein OIU77_006491 [Salix suchowensis]